MRLRSRRYHTFREVSYQDAPECAPNKMLWCSLGLGEGRPLRTVTAAPSISEYSKSTIPRPIPYDRSQTSTLVVCRGRCWHQPRTTSLPQLVCTLPICRT